jgi:hypothetical protein
MTESSRFLTNQLLRLRANPAKNPATDVTMGLQDWVNEKNGMRMRILDMLADVLANDFHEYNARPYARLTAKALESLCDFIYPEDTEFKKAVQVVLDFISAKFAASSLQSRRSVPFRRLIDEENSTALFGTDDHSPSDGAAEKNDEETPRFLQLSGALDALNNERRGAISDRNADTISFTGSSTYRVPDLINRLITQNGSTPMWTSYFDRYHHQGYDRSQQVYEVYAGRPLYLLSAGGVFSPGWDPTGALDSVPVLSDVLSATRFHELVQLLSEKDQASGVWTTLMPAGFKVDRKALIRIEGSTNRKNRNNTCVYPPGFACGLNPVLPLLDIWPLVPDLRQVPGIPLPCVQHAEAGWQFVNLATTDPNCGQDLGLYVAFWSSPCQDDACAADAGGDKPSYGFFDVFDAPSQGISFAQFWQTILSNNRGRSFSYRGGNVYTDYFGRNIFFDPGAPIGVWGILNDNQRDMTAWRPAQGDIVRNLYPGSSPGGLWRPSCVEVDNPVLRRRRVLDLSFHDHPAWCEFDIKPSNMCGCDRERCPPDQNIPCP